MNGIVFDIKKFALHDGPGIRTTIFLKGCPLRCWWCHNPESQKEIPETIKTKSFKNINSGFCEDEISGKEYSVDELLTEIAKDRIFYDESGGGVTFSGGEPLVQVSFLKEILNLCKENDVHTIVDTSGYAPITSFDLIYEFTDGFLFDLKLMDETEHIRYTEVSNKLILKNIRELSDRGNKVTVRVPLIPGITDTEKNLANISEFVSKLNNISRIDLLPYNRLSESKYKRFNKDSKLVNLQTQSEEKLDSIKAVFDPLNIEISVKG